MTSTSPASPAGSSTWINPSGRTYTLYESRDGSHKRARTIESLGWSIRNSYCLELTGRLDISDTLVIVGFVNTSFAAGPFFSKRPEMSAAANMEYCITTSTARTAAALKQREVFRKCISANYILCPSYRRTRTFARFTPFDIGSGIH